MNTAMVTLFSLFILVAIAQANPVSYEEPSSTAQTLKALNGEKSNLTGVISSSDEPKNHTRVKRFGFLMNLLYRRRLLLLQQQQALLNPHIYIGNGHNNVNNVVLHQSPYYG
ncbi:uncharacterized protein LOC112055722 [Bicyclus anynana]|uniref:Uncharacterized protein LOC112055722 n=1 Tax=Bicyclus anynana TaxID=110368 RepID=A0A6J1NYB9_BICAN|nr:uncharacterized protein LOC112055722 [Bicyclus anynana]